MAGAVFSVQLPSWSGLRPLQRSAPSLQLPILNPSLCLPSLLQIRMGGGPRTFPGGVTKWQWKKMQEKKAKQILKARLLRERQLYEMRKRAELKAAMAATNELEKPWEKTAPTLFSVTADDQLQSMADRFIKPGAVDLWTENDGPDHSLRSPDGKPSVRVFPKDVLHSTKPYSRVFNSSTDSEDARSAPSGARLALSETSSEQATEYPFPAGEKNASSKSARREFNRISAPNTVGFRSQDVKFRGNFQNFEKSERYQSGKGNGGSISRPGSGVKGSGVSFRRGVGRIPRLYPLGGDYSSRKSNGYSQMDGAQSFAGFDLAKGSWQKGGVEQSSNEDDYDYDNVTEDSVEISSFG